MNKNIIDFIPFGRENAISQEELAIRMQSDRRTARAAVFNARVRGAVICSTCEGEPTAGYYRPISAAEAVPYVNMQRSRINSAKAALKAAEKYVTGEELR